MKALYLTLYISLLLGLLFLIFFIHSMKSGQYEDAYSPSVRMLFDDEAKQNKEDKSPEKKDKTLDEKKLKTK